MKRDIVSKFWIFLYVNLWYVPLFAFLLGIKISLISMLADSMSVHKTRAVNELQKEQFGNQFISAQHAHTVSPVNKTAKQSGNLGWQQTLRMSHQPLSTEDWKMLDHLEDATIIPSASNR
ncbi:unnamed protein product [Allacma fusca]|uniref:Uncharacterized protein n=2 Tax=Allacma fusca TaxID=39272 RepID=A0A8J2K7R9_9HEXA|nr:unnamed protein product [Allacma fusca]